jgi:hypothetical protein
MALDFNKPMSADEEKTVSCQATTGRPKLIVVIGVWLFFLPAFLASSLILIKCVRLTDWSLAQMLLLVFFGCFWFGSGALLYLSTANYISKRKSRGDEDAT